MRASIRGSIRNVIVTDSEASDPVATAESIKRKSILFSVQKAASASSLSNSGTSSQLMIEFIAFMRLKLFSRLRQILVQLLLIKELLFGSEWTREDHAH